jgi:hypothetical protein
MHDKNGKPIVEGAYVKLKVGPEDKVGLVTKTEPGASTCNIYVQVMIPSFTTTGLYANASDVEVV